MNKKASDFTTRRVLLVDDEPSLSMILKMTLEKMGNYEVELVTDPREALELAIDFQPNVVVLDMVMPGINGIQLAHKLRGFPGFQDLPLIFLSASVSKREHGVWLNTDEGMYQKLDDPIIRDCPLLEKPVTLDNLMATIDEQLGLLTTI